MSFSLIFPLPHWIDGKLNTLILSTNVDQKSLETEFSIVVHKPRGQVFSCRDPNKTSLLFHLWIKEDFSFVFVAAVVLQL